LSEMLDTRLAVPLLSLFGPRDLFLFAKHLLVAAKLWIRN